MPPRKTKPAPKSAKTATRRSRASKPTKPAAPIRKKSPAGKRVTPKSRVAKKIQPLDLSAFPAESVSVLEAWFCIACVSDVFTRHLDFSPRTAHLAIKSYIPSICELSAPTMARPWFTNQPILTYCPYCGAASKWHTRLLVHRIESGKATDTLRRELLKSLPQSGNQFTVLEEKSTQQHAFYEWLGKTSTSLNLDDPIWLREVSRHYLSRKEPKIDRQTQFNRIHSIRRLRRLESGWEVAVGRLLLAPILFDELLLVQYLISRSHRAGGLTLEGRYTLPELFARLRNAGYLRAVGVHAQNPTDALEELVSYLSGGEAGIKFYPHVWCSQRNELPRSPVPSCAGTKAR